MTYNLYFEKSNEIEFIDIYCANHNMNKLDLVLKKDSYSYYMMNIVDYLIGNTDRHWGNWGFYTDNSTNKIKAVSVNGL